MFSMMTDPPTRVGSCRADEGHHRNECVLGGMSHDHQTLVQTLGPGGADVILTQYLQHHGARHAHGACRQGGAENQARNQEHAQVSQRVFAEANQLDRWRPAPPDDRVEHDHHSKPEVGSRQADDCDRPAGVVADRILAHRRIDADGNGYQEADHDGQDAELKRYRQATDYLGLYGLAAPQRLAQRAAQYDIAASQRPYCTWMGRSSPSMCSSAARSTPTPPI